MSEYINSIFNELSTTNHVVLITGVSRCISRLELSVDIISIVFLFYNELIYLNIPRETIIWKTQEMESKLELVWQSEKDLFFGHKNKWKNECDNCSLLFAKIFTQSHEIQANKFVFDVYYESLKQKLYLTITLMHQQHKFAYYYHFYCIQNGHNMENICRSTSIKFNIMLLKDFINNKRCNELQLKFHIKPINIDGNKTLLKRRINDYKLRYIPLNKSSFHLVDNNNKWVIICIFGEDTGTLSLFVQLLSFPDIVSKIEMKCTVEIRCNDLTTNGLIFKKIHNFITRHGYNFRWTKIDPKIYKLMGVIPKHRMLKIKKLALYVSIELLSIHDTQNRKIKQRNWSQYGIII
eukprot:313111_1